jgi:beta-phosphoglucomutase-like phosphatase (HAD superfamily)
MLALADLRIEGIEVVLCDADGCLFPSEEPAFEASARVTNAMLASRGVSVSFDPGELRTATTGRNFRATAQDLAAEFGIGLEPQEIERWVAVERGDVTAHLRTVLRPDPGVVGPLQRIAAEYRLALVSSSALSRLDACLGVTGLAPLFPEQSRFSAEDSLQRPASKPDPAVYLHTAESLGIAPCQGVAVEDSLPGAQSAIAAGFPTIANLAFVPPAERRSRLGDMHRAGVAAVISSWGELERLLLAPAAHQPRSAASNALRTSSSRPSSTGGNSAL